MLKDDYFIADGYYPEESTVIIQVNPETGKVKLFNKLFEVETEWLTPENGKVHIADKDYYISNFISNNNLINFQKDGNQNHKLQKD